VIDLLGLTAKWADLQLKMAVAQVLLWPYPERGAFLGNEPKEAFGERNYLGNEYRSARLGFHILGVSTLVAFSSGLTEKVIVPTKYPAKADRAMSTITSTSFRGLSFDIN
jgi:hypothetical protein